MRPQGLGTACLNFTFEAAHRQPEVGGKCRNLHGHSWRVSVSLYNNTDIGGVNLDTGLSIEFSAAKDVIRTYLNDYFDHATLLGHRDPLAVHLIWEGCKLFLFGGQELVVDGLTQDVVADDRFYGPLPWPSVEAVAFCLGERLQQKLTELMGSYVTIESVSVHETDTNGFVWCNTQAEMRLESE